MEGKNMDYIPVVIAAEYLGNFMIKVEFDNGEERIVDCSKYLHGQMFEPVKDENYFKKFFVDGWTVAWPNGADIAPETLYEDGLTMV